MANGALALLAMNLALLNRSCETHCTSPLTNFRALPDCSIIPAGGLAISFNLEGSIACHTSKV